MIGKIVNRSVYCRLTVYIYTCAAHIYTDVKPNSRWPVPSYRQISNKGSSEGKQFQDFAALT